MKKLLLVAGLLALAGSGVAWADAGVGIQAPTSQMLTKTRIVYNDSGSDITSGAVVIWDNDDTEFDRSGNPYIAGTTTTAQSIHTAGVILDNTCVNGNTCEIVIEGWARTNILGSLSEDTIVATSTTAGVAGDASASNNVCYLGTLLEAFSVPNGATCVATSATCQAPVYVRVTCVP